MKTLVTYMSRTGCTKKVAEAIYSQIESEKEIRDATEVESIAAYDFVFFGYPIENFGPSQQVKEFLEQKCAGKKLAMFVTHAAPEGTALLEPWLGACREAAACADVIAMFDCQGELSQAITEKMTASPDPQIQMFASARPMTIGQPDETRLERARIFARQTLQGVATGM